MNVKYKKILKEIVLSVIIFTAVFALTIFVISSNLIPEYLRRIYALIVVVDCISVLSKPYVLRYDIKSNMFVTETTKYFFTSIEALTIITYIILALH
jgi:hypothetical protein